MINVTADLKKSYFLQPVIKVGIVGALAGLLFGIDVGVISGALKFIALEFNLNVTQQGIVVSSLLVGAVLGTLASGYLSYHFGRRQAILISAIIFSAGALLCAFAPNYQFLVAARIFLGTAVGIASFTAPVYLAEISPRRLRGRIIALYQLMVTIGILLAFLSDTYFSYHGDWRCMLGIIVVPAVIMFAGVLTLPRSPRWLMLRGKPEQALKVLRNLLNDEAEVAREMLDLSANLQRTQKGWKVFGLAYFRRILLLGVALQFIQVMTGMNTMMYYAPKVFELVGFGSATQMWGAVLLGSLNVLATILSLFVIDRVGRRPLLFFGLFFMILGMAMLGLAFDLGPSTALLKNTAVTGMLTFIFGFAISLGPIIWVMCAEIFPLKNRELGVTFTTATNWICSALLGGFFLAVIERIGPAYTFYLLSLLCLLSTLFIYYFVPETKNISLERLEKNLINGKKLRALGD